MKHRFALGVRGFTLIELMTTIAVAAVLFAIAVPSFKSFMRNVELTSTVNTMVASINAARGEAMKRGRRAYVMPTQSSGWAGGWIVFVDQGETPNGSYDAGTDLLVQRQSALPAYLNVPKDGATGTAKEASPYILFNPSGYPIVKGGGFGAMQLTFQLDNASGGDLRRIVIAKTGRVRICRAQTTCTE